MNTKDSAKLQLRINKLNSFAKTIEDLLESAPEGIAINGLITARREALEQIDEVTAMKAEAVKAEEAARLAAKKTVKVRRHSWDPETAVKVELTPTSYSDSSFEVRLDGELLGTVSNFGGKTWSPQAAGSGYTSSYGRDSRADAIRALLR